MLASTFDCFVDRRLPVEVRRGGVGFNVDEEGGEEANALE